MIAVVGDARNLASIRLHESLGFKAVGFLPGAGPQARRPGRRRAAAAVAEVRFGRAAELKERR